MNLVDSKYIGLVSARLSKFKRVKPDLYNFRCPICGDSQKHKNKARGYLYGVKADINFRCHNCGASMTFSNFLKEIDVTMHKQYVFERFKDGKTGRGTVVEEPKFNFEAPKFKPKLDLPKADVNPAAKLYLENRKLDPTKFYYTDRFKQWTNTLKPTFEDVRYDEPRIIIPLIYLNTVVGFQGRSLGPSKVKYITVMINDDAPKIYGLDNIRRDAPVFITEGPFDSTFIRNSIAMCGADADVSRWGISTPVYVYDNEPRSPEIVRRIETAIASQQSVVIWPSHIREKDINDMVLAGQDVQSVVESNVYSGLKAKLQFNTWKRI
jgi:transcription elongation factor Elf1